MHTLITLLGRTNRPADGYQRVDYRFPDGQSRRAAFVGYSLAAHERPDRLVVLGTAGSMWDQLVSDGRSISLPDETVEGLMQGVDEAAATPAQLDVLAAALTEALGHEVELRLIPEGLDEAEQVALLSVLLDATEGADSLSLDITHGYRHLPMLMVMAVLYLRARRPALSIRAIWYAMLHASAGSATLYNVAGLLHFADWLEALQRSELTGDYRGVAALIPDPALADDIARGGFLETIHQGQLARKHFRNARARLREHPLPGAGALFQPLLEARTDWVDEPQLYQRQRGHAFNALDRGDLLRAALYGFEAYVTRLVQETGPVNADPNDRETRQAAKKEYEDNGPSNRDWRPFKRLRALRNVLTHGHREKAGELDETALHSPESMRDTLAQALAELLPETRR
ncbi:TIGR02221 family CRISPR-associated protein [Arhodomonas sp. KWT]|uniref:TIGR02221 family CRISPR-associated protein n=1 Tax=Arhodomonas sp. KWT TaxID=2679915 RepID=UPI0013D50E26|nr:TIGR02221 family CRISPR-associated protein [Arhodomonas sp. KWT]